ncbi:hypothetical protein [Mycobacterium riyadhense]|uniref:hypothetical protein n=1 Tax=Mycobacterium riyadhense TaxID=486698 RepID=UPI001EF9DF06|nr:hypothetical protein [Mycobacterium riyadhense]
MGGPKPTDALGAAFIWWSALLDRAQYTTALHSLTWHPPAWGDYEEAFERLSNAGMMQFVERCPDGDDIAYVKFLPNPGDHPIRAFGDALLPNVHVLTMRLCSDGWGRAWGLSENYFPSAEEVRTLRTMTGQARDARLESHIREFLSALNERLERDQFVKQRMADVARPAPRDVEDFRRYISEFRAVLVEAIGDKYERIATHGPAILELTDEPEITERVPKMLGLAAQEGRDAIKKIESLDEITQRTDGVTGLKTLITFAVAQARIPRLNRQLNELTVELTIYCLRRFPPAEQ